MKRGFFIPADIWEREDLTLHEKVILAEVVSFHKDGKECYISNETFGKMISASPWTASMAVSSLTAKGLIKRTGFDGKKRYLALCKTQSQPCENPKATHVKNKRQTCEKQKAAFGKSQEIIPTDTTYPSVAIINNNDNKGAKRFVKPTYDELKSYADEIGFYPFDPQSFLDYYDSNGWKVGRNSMKDWHAAVRTWKRKDEERGRQATPTSRTRPNIL